MRRCKADAEQTRSSIMDAAERMFVKNGVGQTSLEQIARAAGVTRGAVYWHFKDKADLLQAMYERNKPPQVELLRMAANGSAPGWIFLVAPLVEALLWPLVTRILLAPQRRAPDSDENRPL